MHLSRRVSCTVAALVLWIFAAVLVSAKIPCQPRKYDQSSVVCVCTANLCDDLDVNLNEKWPLGKALQVESSLAGARFQLALTDFDGPHLREEGLDCDDDNEMETKPKVKTITLAIDRNKTYQEIIGFGGAFTDAATINIKSLPAAVASRLVADYFAPDGIQYSLGRVPIGGTDFSTRAYTYDMFVDEDFALANFSLQSEDRNYKIPVIQAALNASSQAAGGYGLSLFASPWSAPAWMKTNNALTGQGYLRGGPGSSFYDTWAQYFVKFFDSYKAEGIDFWGLTVQNEPTDGTMPKFAFNSMGWHAGEYREFVRCNLGPALDKAGYTKDKMRIMIWDDDRNFMSNFVNEVMTNDGGYVAGFAAHWYFNVVGPKIFDDFHAKWPERFILATEACNNYLPWSKPKVRLGDWSAAEAYAKDIMADLEHWVAGWTDWNLALDPQGGPNWVKNFVDSPIIVNATAGEYYKQPMFYALGHFSKFLPPGAIRVDLALQGKSWRDSIDGLAFLTPDRKTTVVILHNMESKKSFNIQLDDGPALGKLTTALGPKSLKTIVWRTAE